MLVIWQTSTLEERVCHEEEAVFGRPDRRRAEASGEEHRNEFAKIGVQLVDRGALRVRAGEARNETNEESGLRVALDYGGICFHGLASVSEWLILGPVRPVRKLVGLTLELSSARLRASAWTNS
jgi:hypothetical protein